MLGLSFFLSLSVKGLNNYEINLNNYEINLYSYV